MEFGFLIDTKEIQFGDVKIQPLPDYAVRVSRFYQNSSVSHGFYYPPLTQLQKTANEQTLFPSDTQINSPFYRLESTHSIEKLICDKEIIQFMILVYGFLHGVYLRPDNYLCVKKTPYEIGKLTGVISPTIDECKIGLRAFSTFYENSSYKKRKLLFSIVHWFLLGQCYEYAWDRFTAQYQVLDSLFKISGLNTTHAQRPQELAVYYGLNIPTWAVYDATTSSCRLSVLRNDLFHEAIYAGQPIGYAYPDENFDLEFVRFNLQLIISTVGLNSPILRLNVNGRAMNSWNF